MASKGYTTRQQVENYLLIDIDPSFYTQVDDWIKTAEDIVDRWTGRDFTPASDTATDRVYDGTGEDTIRIDPVADVTGVSLAIGGDPIDPSQYVLYPSNVDNKTSIVLKYLKFPLGNANITVTGKFGYEEVPSDIQFATTVLVAGIINKAWDMGSSTTGGGEVQSLSIGRYSVTYGSGSSSSGDTQIEDFAKVEDILDSYKKYSF